MSTTTYTKFEVEGRVARITINRPEVRNCLGPYVLWELSKHFDEVERNDDIWIAVITGAGDRSFCAGADLKFHQVEAQMTHSELEDLKRKREESVSLNRRWYFPKPVIARVNGYAVGGGLELALSCDIVVATDHAELGLPEPKRGLVAGAGGVHRLPRQIGLKPAMGYLLTGRHIPAPRAYELGLINDVVPFDQLDTTVNSYIEDMLACAPLSVRATKEMVMRGLDHTLQDAFESQYVWERRRQSSPDAKEGPRAFAEKRAPVWQGEYEE